MYVRGLSDGGSSDRADRQTDRQTVRDGLDESVWCEAGTPNSGSVVYENEVQVLGYITK